MVYIILSVFVLTALLAFVEDRLPKKYNMILYLFLGFVLVLVAGLRKIGVDPDSIRIGPFSVGIKNEPIDSLVFKKFKSITCIWVFILVLFNIGKIQILFGS